VRTRFARISNIIRQITEAVAKDAIEAPSTDELAPSHSLAVIAS
jgi:hypothetical protein